VRDQFSDFLNFYQLGAIAVKVWGQLEANEANLYRAMLGDNYSKALYWYYTQLP